MADTKTPQPFGRPVKYDPKYVQEVDKYLAKCSSNKKLLPTLEGFSLSINVDHDTIVNWANKKAKIVDATGNVIKDKKGNDRIGLVRPDFFGAIKRIKQVQKDKLITDGLYGGKEVNSTMAIFLLKVNHGMIETSRQELTGKNGKELPTPILGGQSNVHTDNSNK